MQKLLKLYKYIINAYIHYYNIYLYIHITIYNNILPSILLYIIHIYAIYLVII